MRTRAQRDAMCWPTPEGNVVLKMLTDEQEEFHVVMSANMARLVGTRLRKASEDAENMLHEA